MTFFFAIFFVNILPLALISGVLSSGMHTSVHQVKGRTFHCWAVLTLFSGGILASICIDNNVTNSVQVLLRQVGVATLFITCLSHLVLRDKFPVFHLTVAYLVTAILGIQSGFDLALRLNNESFTATSVINTEAILNIFGILVAIGLLYAVFQICQKLFTVKTIINSALFILILLMYGLDWCGDIFLAALQNNWLEVTSTRVRVIALLDIATPLFPYVYLVSMIVLAWQEYANHQGRIKDQTATESVVIFHRRQKAARKTNTQRFLARIMVMATLLITLGYENHIAHLPQDLSPATLKTPDENGKIIIPIAEAADGKLHRYAYISSDGHRVRFFLINKYDQNNVRLGVVLDACMICGDAGYVEKDGEVICIGCHVRLFKPTIGKPGGCNPIPLEHTYTETEIIIDRSELEYNARYFSEIIDVDVTDPVSGGKLSNTTAKYQYQYAGVSYFFENEDNYVKFRESPEQYVPPQFLKNQTRQ